MITHSVIQGTSEWEALRLGIPTGSAFDRIVTPGKKPSGDKTQEKYMYELLGERMTGMPDKDFKSKWMERGQTMEIDAVRFYELQRDLNSVPVGFITNDAGTIGASPDRLVGDIGLMEIKCPSQGVHVSYLLGSGSPYEEYKVQVQGQLWISDRQWCDVVSYNPFMPMALVRIERDDEFIKVMAPLIEAFSMRLEAKSLELAEKGWLAKPKEPHVFSAEIDAKFAEWSKGQ